MATYDQANHEVWQQHVKPQAPVVPPVQMLSGLEPSAPPLDEVRTSEPARAKCNWFMVGKTAAGKSATANTLSGQKGFFQEGCGFQSTTRKVKTLQYTVDICLEEQKVALDCTAVDLPGLMDTNFTPEELAKRLAQFVLASPEGFEAVLCVVKMGAMTNEELLVLDMVERLFGEGIWSHCILVVTHCRLPHDQLTRELEKLENTNKLRRVWEQCGRRAAAIDNYFHGWIEEADAEQAKSSDKAQSREYIHKLLIELSRNSQPYTNDSFEKAREAVNQVVELTRSDCDLLRQQRDELEAELRLGQIDTEAFRQRMEHIESQERDFAKTKKRLELEQLAKSIQRSEWVKDVAVKLGIGVACTAVAAGSATAAAYSVGSALMYATNAASMFAASPFVRLGGIMMAGMGMSSWWSASFRFGRGEPRW